MKKGVTLAAVGGVALLVVAAAAWRQWSKADPARGRRARVEGAGPAASSSGAAPSSLGSAPSTPGAPAVPAPALPRSPSGKAALEIAARLDKLRIEEEYRRVRREKLSPEEKVLEESRRDEVKRLEESLRERLQAHPEEWSDVCEQLSGVPSLMVVLRLARTLSGVVDPSVEPALIEQLRFGARPNGRRAAVVLLADSASPDAVPAFIEAVQRDSHSGVRYAAFLELIRRRNVPEFKTHAPAIEQVVKRQTEVEPDLGVRRLMTRYLPGNAPPLPPYKPRHKGGRRPPKRVGR